MDPYQEHRIIAEAIYLHSLWHRGPPRPPSHHLQPPPHHHFQPPQHHQFQPPQHHQSQPPTPSTHLLHLPIKPTNFKKKKKRNHNKKIPPGSDKEWPCNPSSGDPTESSSDWSRAWPKHNLEPLLLSGEERGKISAIQAQSKALKVTTAYFFDSDDDESESESESDDLEDYDFFVNLFEEDKVLGEYYSKNYQNGEFVCLVCGGLGKKLAGKKYKGCMPLVQHSISIGNTKKRKAHRSFGQAICKVLGWDIGNLSSIVSALATSRANDGLDVPETTIVEGAAQEGVDEGSKEGSGDATVLCQGEVCDGKDKLEENVGEEINVSSCNGDTLPVQECSGGGISENNGGSVLLENSGTGTAGPISGDDGVSAVPTVVVDGQTDILDQCLEPSKDGYIASTVEGENDGSTS